MIEIHTQVTSIHSFLVLSYMTHFYFTLYFDYMFFYLRKICYHNYMNYVKNYRKIADIKSTFYVRQSKYNIL